jgi:ankyrin repeat protein
MGTSRRDPCRRGGASSSSKLRVEENDNVSRLLQIVKNHTRDETNTDEHYEQVLKELENGEDPNQIDSKGQSVLIACANTLKAFYDSRVAELLVEWGSDVNAKFEGKTAIQWAATRGNSRGALHLHDFIEDFFSPTTVTYTTSDTVNIIKDDSASTITTTTTTVTTAYRTVKRPKLV